jgi:hypothetical protein
MSLKRLSVSDLQRHGLLTVGKIGLLKFAEGTRATVACLQEREISISHLGIDQTVRIVSHRLRRGSRNYFLCAGRRVSHLYFDEKLGFASRHAASLAYQSESVAKPNPIPRKGTEAKARLAAQVVA